MAPNDPKPGRFVVKLKDTTHTGLAAHEVQELLADGKTDVLEIQRIHRLTDDGHMELVGVSASDFEQRDCLLFSRHHVKEARHDFDRIVEQSRQTPPPCRIEVQFGHVSSFSPTHVVALIFPSVCSEAVGQWLTASDLQLGDHADGSPGVLRAYEAESPRIVKRADLSPR
ncbi:MAG: hypothetical protein MI923_06925 [Phycisphaerales bacterium]|nr:hypothetical protein [Phycisphaerales bacterium]